MGTQTAWKAEVGSGGCGCWFGVGGRREEEGGDFAIIVVFYVYGGLCGFRVLGWGGFFRKKKTKTRKVKSIKKRMQGEGEREGKGRKGCIWIL